MLGSTRLVEDQQKSNVNITIFCKKLRKKMEENLSFFLFSFSLSSRVCEQLFFF